MKNLLLICLALFVCTSINAQSDDEEFEAVREVWNNSVKKAQTEFLTLDDAQSKTFWSIYERYEADRKMLGEKRYKLISEYLEIYSDVDDAKADEMMKTSFSIRKEKTKILEKYYKEVSKALGGKIAAQFVQVETHFDRSMDITLSKQLPFVGDDKSVE